MMNQVICVGRLQDMQFNNQDVILTLRVPRYFKNDNGQYESDDIVCTFNNTRNIDFREMVSIQDVVGIKGRMISENGIMKVVAEKITFLSSKNNSVSNYD